MRQREPAPYWLRSPDVEGGRLAVTTIADVGTAVIAGVEVDGRAGVIVAEQAGHRLA
jgi:hypothetical protein